MNTEGAGQGEGPATNDPGQRRVIWVNRFFHPDESATAIMLTDLVRGLAAGGRPHLVLTSMALYAPRDPARQDVAIDGVDVVRLPAIGRSNRSLTQRVINFVLFHIGVLVMLLVRARKGDIVVTLTDPPLIGVTAAFAARSRGARTANWVQDIFPETATRLGYARAGGFLDRMLRGLRDISWRKADANIAIGKGMAGFVSQSGVPEERIQVIQNWADDTKLVPIDVQQNELRQAWGYENGNCLIGYSGNLGRAHEVNTMAATMSELGTEFQNGMRFLFIGGGAKSDGMLNAAAALPEGMLAFRPYQPMELLAQSLSVPDIHWLSLLPELEGLIVPSKFYGALAVGRPVVFIGDTRGEIACLVAEAGCGASFEIGDSPGVARFLRELAAQPELRREIGRKGRAFLESELSRSGRVAHWRRVLDRIDSGSG